MAALFAILIQTLVPNFAMAAAGRVVGQTEIAVADLLTGGMADLAGSWCGEMPGDDGQVPAAVGHGAPCAFCLVMAALFLPPDRVAGILAFPRTGPPAAPARSTGPPNLPNRSPQSPRAPPVA